MEPSQESFNWFIRRWQVRLFVAGFVLPAIMFALFVFVDRAGEESTVACGLTAAVMLLTSFLLQCWIAPQKRSRKPSQGSVPAGRNETV